MLDIGVKIEGKDDFEGCTLQIQDNSNYRSGGWYDCVLIEDLTDEATPGEEFRIHDCDIESALNSHPTTSVRMEILDFSTPLFETSEMNTAIILGLVK